MLHIVRISVLLAMMAFASGAVADTPDVEKYKNFTPEQIKAIPDSERQKNVPMMYILAAQKGLAVDARLAFSMDLNLLMYPGVNDFPTAVKMFQKDIDEAPTGILTVSQIHKLGVRAEFQKLGPISFPTPFSSQFSADFATVSGTMIILDDRIAWPVNYSIVTCYKSDRSCERWSTSLVLPKEGDWIRADLRPFLSPLRGRVLD